MPRILEMISYSGMAEAGAVPHKYMSAKRPRNGIYSNKEAEAASTLALEASQYHIQPMPKIFQC